ncbi:MAG TPA: PAS domain S-box protein [Bryobacteraceae bacterium]|nr:PAS domain S-box protein [Bryobacteraceae bacterium]
MDWRRLSIESRGARYGVAVALAVVAQLATLPFVEPTSMPLISYAPFLVISALAGGLGPGLVTTILCTLEAAYFVIEPTRSFAIADRKDWDRLAALLLTGVVAGILSEGVRRFASRLAEANRKTNALLESISDGFNAFDRNWRYVYVNTAGARMVGKAREELLGKNLWELWPEAVNSPFGIAYRRAVAENVPTQVEAFFAPLNAWFEVRCYPSAEGLSLFFTDTTARRRAQEQLRLLAAIVECSDDAIIGKDLDGTILSWNKGAEQIYGYSAAEMIGQSVSRLVPSDHGDEFPEIMQYVQLGQKIEHLETERIRKDGRRIAVSVTISPLKDEAGKVVGASSIARDITGRKQAEQALARSELRYRSLVRAVSQIVWTTNSRGEVIEDLAAWREFTGQSVEETQGWGRFAALHPGDRARSAEAWSRALAGRSLYETEYRLRRHDGEYRWMAVHGVPVLNEDGQVEEWVGTCADITDRVLAEEEARQLNQTLEKRVVERTSELEAANQELEAFAYSVSHDLRAPLRAIGGFSRILLEDFSPELPAEAQRYLGIVSENAVQMGKLIDGLLSFSRLGRQALNLQQVAPSDLVRQAWVDLAAEQKGREVEICLGDLPPCQGDPLLLKQVFLNLLSNSLKYTRNRPVSRVEVGCFRASNLAAQTEVCQQGAPRGAAPDSPVYYVRDNGAGFDMRYSDKLFGVFQRLHRSEEYEGTGVGLATVRRIITRHGGSVWAEGALDQGATFYFTLDTPAEVQASGAPGTSAAALSGERS